MQLGTCAVNSSRNGYELVFQNVPCGSKFRKMEHNANIKRFNHVSLQVTVVITSIKISVTVLSNRNEAEQNLQSKADLRT